MYAKCRCNPSRDLQPPASSARAIVSSYLLSRAWTRLVRKLPETGGGVLGVHFHKEKVSKAAERLPRCFPFPLFMDSLLFFALYSGRSARPAAPFRSNESRAASCSRGRVRQARRLASPCHGKESNMPVAFIRPAHCLSASAYRFRVHLLGAAFRWFLLQSDPCRE